MKRAYIFVNKILFRFMILVVLLSIVELVLTLLFGFDRGTVIYWLAMFSKTAWDVGPILFIGCLIYFFVTLILFHRPLNQLVTTNAVLMMFLSIVAGVFFVGSSFVIGWSGWREHIATSSLSRYTYQLQTNTLGSDDPLIVTYHLYECEFNLFCKEIYWISKGNGIDPDVETIELLPDATHGIFNVRVNGDVAFTRNPELGTCSVEQGYSDFC